MHASIRQTKESGIYDNWLKVYSQEPEAVAKALAEYSKGKLEHFVGLFVICGAFLAVALLLFLCESSFLLSKRCNAETTSKADVNVTAQDVLRLLTDTDVTASSYFRRRMSILHVVWAGMLAGNATNTMPKALNKAALQHSPNID